MISIPKLIMKTSLSSLVKYFTKALISSSADDNTVLMLGEVSCPVEYMRYTYFTIFIRIFINKFSFSDKFY